MSAAPGRATTVMCAPGNSRRNSRSAATLITASPSQLGKRTTMRLILSICGFFKLNYLAPLRFQFAAANLFPASLDSGPKCSSAVRAPATDSLYQLLDCIELSPRLYRLFHAATAHSGGRRQDYTARGRPMNQ